jgi:hypothetical protein
MRRLVFPIGLATLIATSTGMLAAHAEPIYVEQGPQWTAATRADFYTHDQPLVAKGVEEQGRTTVPRRQHVSLRLPAESGQQRGSSRRLPHLGLGSGTTRRHDLLRLSHPPA